MATTPTPQVTEAPELPSLPKEDLVTSFISTVGPTKFTLKNKKKIYFYQGKYSTSDSLIISLIKAEIADGAPFLIEFDGVPKSQVDPEEKLKREGMEFMLNKMREAKANKSGDSAYTPTLIMRGNVTEKVSELIKAAPVGLGQENSAQVTLP